MVLSYLPLLGATSARLVALGPLAGVPLDRTVEHVAVLPVRRGGLGTHTVGHDHGVATTSGHLKHQNTSAFNILTTKHENLNVWSNKNVLNGKHRY